jgi:nucleoside-diphosphate-sugar epimerase
MHKIMRGVRFCLHQAALSSVPRSIEDPAMTTAINIGGTLNTLLAARDADVERVVAASSSSVYGNSEVLPKREDMCPNPLSPYALSKLTAEQYTVMFHALYGLQTVSLRYFNVFGKRQNPDSPYAAVVPIFIAAMMRERPVTVHGDGEQSRDFCHVDNVVSANLLACSATAAGVAGGVFNIACGERHTINELVEQLNTLLGKHTEPLHTPPRQGDVRDSLADIERARNSLGYEPLIRFGEGLQKTVQWFRDSAGTG